MDVTEAMLKEAAIGARVTLEQVEGFISTEQFFTALEGVKGSNPVGGVAMPYDDAVRLGLLTICVLVLKNGFTVLGKSACADPNNYKSEIGQALARKDAVGQIWPLLGFELLTKLAIVRTASPLSGAMLDHYPAETYLGSKVVHAAPMSRGDYNTLRGWVTPADEGAEDEGYFVQYADGGKANQAGFTGYVSWSPKDVFEASYLRVDDSPVRTQ